MSFTVVIVQYLIPCALVAVCYTQVCQYLKSRPILTNSANQRKVQAKRTKNNRMLIVVAIFHFLSWLPLNVVNVIMTTFDSDQAPLFQDVENLFITYAICHLASMTSALSNPILYGYLNENFRAEFRKIGNKFKREILRMNTQALHHDVEQTEVAQETVRMSILRRRKKRCTSEAMVSLAIDGDGKQRHLHSPEDKQINLESPKEPEVEETGAEAAQEN